MIAKQLSAVIPNETVVHYLFPSLCTNTVKNYGNLKRKESPAVKKHEMEKSLPMEGREEKKEQPTSVNYEESMDRDLGIYLFGRSRAPPPLKKVSMQPVLEN